MLADKHVYLFAEGNKDMKGILGGKGANLAEMKRIGLPIPPGFIITTTTCLLYYEDKDIMAKIRPAVLEALHSVEAETGKRFNDEANPLLLSVRSGAPVSMPGMMDTVLNLGLNDKIVEGLAKISGNRRFALDSYRRFIQMFGDVVMGVEHDHFEKILSARKAAIGPNAKDTDLTETDLEAIIAAYKAQVKADTGIEFPVDPVDQLFRAIEAVFKSWNIPRALTYRKLNKIPNYGTAVNVQTMVFGNMGEDSATGVAFTRNPSTGERKYYGEFLVNAQGEDVVAGIRTPREIQDLQQVMPGAYKQLVDIFELLEKHYTDMQDIEFTIEKDVLYMLQCRNGKRTTQAAVKIAMDMLHEGLIDEKTAVTRVDAYQLDQLLHKRIDEKAKVTELAKGLAASPGAAIGQAVFDANDAEHWVHEQKKKVILCRPETKPDDIHGMVVAEGVITQHGGMTSHAAVVARGMGKPCVSGIESIKIDVEGRKIIAGDVVIKEGDVISIDGSSGKIFAGAVPLIEPSISGEFEEILKLADKHRTLGVRSNADTPLDAKNSIRFGAEGIGLCRTEHMFMAQDRLPVVQQMILAKTKEAVRDALAKIEAMQTGDFHAILKEMAGKPVIIRLLDPPLHEFLPALEELLLETQELKLKNGDPKRIEQNEELVREIRAMSEANPMLGLRGCRLGITRPEINEMQVRAIITAAVQLKKEGIDAKPKIMIPLIGTVRELQVIEPDLRATAKRIIDGAGVKLDYEFGTMIEIPRAALTSAEIAKVAEFFSFGTNDLTQMTFGYSRDDAEGKFLPQYIDKKILDVSPFESIDEGGVGRLVGLSVEEGRSSRPTLECGVCGEHGGDPRSIDFFHRAGLNYVSCSPFRVPVARLAAAQAAIKHGKK